MVIEPTNPRESSVETVDKPNPPTGTSNRSQSSDERSDDEGIDFDDESTVLMSKRSFAPELKEQIVKALSLSIDSNDSDLFVPPLMRSEEVSKALEDDGTVFETITIETVAKFNKLNRELYPDLPKEKIPEFQCSKFIPKIGPREWKPPSNSTAEQSKPSVKDENNETVLDVLR
jgi:hypothetical protein